MKLLQWLAMASLLMPNLGHGADEIVQCGEPAPRLTMPRPPRTPMVFTRIDGRERETLEIRYVRPGTIKFVFERKGRCTRHEEGTANIQPCWWLGAESDENEAGEAVDVQEYVFNKNSRCSMSLRIDEWDWKQSTITEATACSRDCPSSGEIMLGKR